jgi:hypothetical protein
MIQHDMVMKDQVSVDNPDPNDATWMMCGPRECTATSTMSTLQANGVDANILEITPSSNTYAGSQTIDVTCKLTNYPTKTLTKQLTVNVDKCIVTAVTKSGTT